MPQTRQLAAIMFTDIVGYTALMGRDEQKAFDFLNKNRQIQKPIIEQHGGHWIKELGDGVMASFNTVSDAVIAAIKIQEACNASKDFQLRIGIHLGEVVFEAGDVFGDGVNVASRIQAKAPPGGIWISESVHNNVVNKNDIVTRFVKTEHLKNVKDPVRIYEVLGKDLPVTRPGIPLIKSGGKKGKIAVGLLGIILLLLAGYFIYQFLVARARKNTEPTSIVATDKSIAVLPFEDLSPEKDQEWLGDGIAEEIISSITAINDLKVIGRTSSFQYKGKGLDAKTIGEKLKVGNILEGSIQRSGDDLRIITKLVRVKDNFSIWSQRFDKKLQDIFAIQDSIAFNIVEKLRLTISNAEKPRLIKKGTGQDVYTLYLKGLHTYKEFALEKSIEYNLRAIKIDSTFAPSYAYIALAKTWIINRDHVFDDYNAVREAKEFARRAINLDPNLAEGYSALALLAWSVELDFPESKSNFEKSIQLNPSASLIKNRFAYFLLWMGDFDKVNSLAHDAINSDPADWNGYVLVASAYVYKGQFSEAEKYIAEGQRLFPDRPEFDVLSVTNSFHSGNYERVTQLVKSLQVKYPSLDDGILLSYLCLAYYRKGNHTESNATLEQLKKKPEDKKSSNYFGLARIYSEYKNKDSCFIYLEKSFTNREPSLKTLKIDPLLDFVRSDPRYGQLYHRYGFDRYQ
jgi:adenylate cyclase